MAEADYNVADRQTVAADGTRTNVGAGTNVEAGDKVAETVQATPDSDAAAFADAANVSRPEYANYAAALDALTERADIEGLAERRARENGVNFTEGDFMRRQAYEADGTASAAPRPGTLHGNAPDNGVAEATN